MISTIFSDGILIQYRFDIPKLPGMFVGTGDIFTSLLVVWLDKFHGNIKLAIEKVISSIQGLLRRTGEKLCGKSFLNLFRSFNWLL